MVKVLELEQPFNKAVTVMVAATGVVNAFIEVKAGIGLAVPFAASPMVGLLFVQEKVAPGVTLLKFNGPTVAPAQTIIFAGTTGTGVGLIVIGLFTVVVPHSLVTESETVYAPGVLYTMLPGFADVDVAGVPPGNDQA